MNRTLQAIAVLLLAASPAFGQRATLLQEAESLQKTFGIHFIYSPEVNLSKPYKGPSLKGHPLEQSLNMLFAGADVVWKRQGSNVVLTLAHQHKHKVVRHTVSGWVTDHSQETLVNATVCDLTTGASTLTNEHGFFSLTLPEGPHTLRFSYVGYTPETQTILLNNDKTLRINLSDSNALDEAVVTTDLNSPLLRTSTGKRTFTSKDLNSSFALLSSPDLVKTLQLQSGVASGVDLASGLYVHGGDNDENLYLLDGSQLYQANHSLGLFSAFNTDIIKNVDFYKSGFPARFGGRLSSITDVRTKDGNMERLHGSFSLGLLDGRLNFEGPIVKDRTSFLFGMRRSWLEVLSKPIFLLVNASNDDEKLNIDYMLHDINAKVTHRFSNKSQGYVSIYSGQDRLRTHDKDLYMSSMPDDTRNTIAWGNLNTTLNWNYQPTAQMQLNLAALFTYNHSRVDYYYKSYYGNSSEPGISVDEEKNRSKIYDTKLKADADFRPNDRHKVNFGANYTYHIFRPQTFYYSHNTSEEMADTTYRESRYFSCSHEASLYGEDEWKVTDRWNVDFGVNLSLFATGRKTYARLDPRVASRYSFSEHLSAKASYTIMSQYVHRIASTYLDMPTDYWIPTTRELRPSHSQQVAAGIYWHPAKGWDLSVEGFYKTTRHMLMNKQWNGVMPSASRWNKDMTEGTGRSYGMEIEARYRSERLSMDMAYTLSWARRHFAEIYDKWFYDKFDNRHKFNVSLHYRFNKRVSAYAAWQFHTGNRYSLPSCKMALPDIPGNEGELQTSYYYKSPNNASLPAYHRLDVGADFHHTTKRGRERIWNVSIYNAYCHWNTMYVDFKEMPNGRLRAKCKGFVPIIPSFSYTIKF